MSDQSPVDNTAGRSEDQNSSLPPPTLLPMNVEIENLALEVRPGERVAFGWEPWFATDDGNNIPRLEGIEGAQVGQAIIAEHRFDAALIQQVQAIDSPGTLTFTMRFRVDPTTPENRERPAGFVVGVGIDPTGRRDPRAASVRWGLRDLPYSKTVTTSVSAEVGESLPTLFVRTIAFIPGSNAMAANGSAGLKYCKVRTAYERTFLLLRQDASLDVWLAAAQHAHSKKWTIGASADDAGLGVNAIGSVTVIAINHTQSQFEELRNWLKTHYSLPESNCQSLFLNS